MFYALFWKIKKGNNGVFECFECGTAFATGIKQCGIRGDFEGWAGESEVFKIHDVGTILVTSDFIVREYWIY